MHPFCSFIHNYCTLTEATWQAVEKSLKVKNLKEGEHVLEAGEICQHLHFLAEGLMRYYIVRNGEEQTKFFTINPYLFTSQASYIREKAATESIQCIEDGTIYSLHKRDAEVLNDYADWCEFSLLIKEEVQGFTEAILENLQCKTPRERYVQMLENSAHWVHRIPLKYIASYLGIAAPSLSRIRKQVLGGN